MRLSVVWPWRWHSAGSPPAGRRTAVLLLLVAATSPLSRCGDEETSAGVWTGDVRDSHGGTGSVTLKLTQSGSNLRGTWAMLFGPSSQLNEGGSLTGRVQGESIDASLGSSEPCVLKLTAARSGTHIYGSYAATGCATPQTGSIDLDRQ